MSTLFQEKQYFAPRWVFPTLAVFILITNIVVMFLFRAVEYDAPSGDIWFFVLSPFIVLIFQFIWLRTEVDEQGISINFSRIVKKRYSFSEISSMYIRQYRPIKEYGGWGIKGWSLQNRAFNIKGNVGLQLELSNSDRVLIGTQKAQELSEVLSQTCPAYRNTD